MSDSINNSVKYIKSLSGMEAEEEISNFLKRQMLAIGPVIPYLMKHKCWQLRCEIIYKIGYWGLSQFLDNVLERLENDNNVIVRCYAMGACYELMWQDAVPIFRKYTKSQDMDLRVSALTMLYIVTNEDTIFEEISKIMLRKNCSFIHKGTFVHTLEAYIVLKDHPNVMNLLERIIEVSDPDLGLIKDIKVLLEDNRKE